MPGGGGGARSGVGACELPPHPWQPCWLVGPASAEPGVQDSLHHPFALKTDGQLLLQYQLMHLERSTVAGTGVADAVRKQLHLLPEMSRRVQVQLVSTADIEEEEN